MYFVRIIGHVEEMHAHIRITWKRLMFMLMGEKRISLHVLTDMNTTVKKPVSARYDDRKPVFRIRNILMRIRIRGSASGMMDPKPGPVLDPDPT